MMKKIELGDLFINSDGDYYHLVVQVVNNKFTVLSIDDSLWSVLLEMYDADNMYGTYGNVYGNSYWSLIT